MSLQWFRFYAEALNDPKVQRLSGSTFKNWLNVLCLASKSDGVLPPIPDIAFALRMGEPEAATAISELRAAGLIDEAEPGLMPHNWEGRQYQSDSSKNRTRAWRDRKRHGDGKCDVTVFPQGGVTVTPPDQNRYRTEQNRPYHNRPERVAMTVEDLVEWHAFGLWAICGWDRNHEMVLEALEARVPEFLEAEARHWQEELERGHRCTFYDDFVPALTVYRLPLPTPETKPLVQAAMDDPRVDRMQAYLARCTQDPKLCDPWPDYETWREAAWAA